MKINKGVPVGILMGFLIAVGAYTKEFYIGGSGKLQIGDAFFLLAFLLAILKRKIHICRQDYWLIAFVTAAVIIDTIYSVLYDDNSFLIYASYLIYSTIIVLLTRSTFQCDKNNLNELEMLSIALKCAIITQIIISSLHGGRYLYGRYTGTFNDPNQFGYYCLMSLFILTILDEKLGRETRLIWIALVGYLIVLSKSSGMILGFSIYLSLFIWNGSLVKKHKRLILMVIRVGAVCAILFAVIIGVVLYGGIKDSSFKINIAGFQRIMTRLAGNTSFNGIIMAFLKDRAATRVLRNPIGFLYGTGEGRWTRYIEGNEIHSTMISLCFYYGIIPYTMFIVWIFRNIKYAESKTKIVCIAAILEAFTLANHRQPFFWMMFVLASLSFQQENMQRINDGEK